MSKSFATKDPKTEALLTIPQVMELTQQSRASVNRWIKGTLKSLKIGRSRRIDRRDLEQFLAGCRQQAV